MSVNNKSINRNNHRINQTHPAELMTDPTVPPAAVASAGEAGEPFIVLDDVAPPAPPYRSLASGDLTLLRAMQSILEKRQTDIWIDEMRAQISTELEWNEA